VVGVLKSAVPFPGKKERPQAVNVLPKVSAHNCVISDFDISIPSVVHGQIPISAGDLYTVIITLGGIISPHTAQTNFEVEAGFSIEYKVIP
jgi:hypothetical protein